MARKKTIKTRERFFKMTPKKGGVPWKEYKKTPQRFFERLFGLRSVLRDTETIERVPLDKRSDVADFVRFLDEAEEYGNAGQWFEAMQAMFNAGEKYAEAGLRAEAEKYRNKMKPFRDHNDDLRLTPAQLKAQLDKWDAKIKASGIPKKKFAMKQLGIKSSTYYDYRKKLKRHSGP